jgi:ATP-binding protein involved in chromosome partitioning
MATKEQIMATLSGIKYPGFSRDIVSFGIVKDVQVNAGAVSVQIQLTSPNQEAANTIQQECEAALKNLAGVEKVWVEVQAPKGAPGMAPGSMPGTLPKLPGVDRIIAVASGKGGVGKSTVSANLACAFTGLGYRVGLLDCDIYGPSIPLMMGVNERPQVSPNEKLIPLESHGVRLMSMGFLLEGDTPVIWRGPMIVKTIQQFLNFVEWGELDALLVDLPPGTGDAQLTLCQSAPLDGGVIVTTPQEASLGVVRKGIAMFQKVNVPILGIIENMSYYTAPNGERVEIFGHGGGRKEAERQEAGFLGEIPIFVEIREGGDQGKPVAAAAPKSPAGQAFIQVAQTIAAKWSL